MLPASGVAEWWVSVADNCMNDERAMPIETETCVCAERSADVHMDVHIDVPKVQ